MSSGLTQEQLNALSPYGYVPSLATCIVFIVIYSLSTILHLYQGVSRPHKVAGPRRTWMLLFFVGGLIQIIGWAGRLWSWFNVQSDGFLMQICCLVISPTFFSAGLYVLLALLINDLAPHRSLISYKWCKIVFLVADVFSLVIQAVGGGIAATAATGDHEQEDLGSKIMLAGIAFQLFVMLAYVAYWAVWAYRARPELASLQGPAGKAMKLQFVGMAICSLMIIIRGFYRCVELGDGFSGPLATNQDLFLLDAIPISIAIWSMNFFHPRYFLQPIQERAEVHKNVHAPFSETSTVVEMQAAKTPQSAMKI